MGSFVCFLCIFTPMRCASTHSSSSISELRQKICSLRCTEKKKKKPFARPLVTRAKVSLNLSFILLIRPLFFSSLAFCALLSAPQTSSVSIWGGRGQTGSFLDTMPSAVMVIGGERGPCYLRLPRASIEEKRAVVRSGR